MKKRAAPLLPFWATNSKQQQRATLFTNGFDGTWRASLKVRGRTATIKRRLVRAVALASTQRTWAAPRYLWRHAASE